MRIKGFGLAKTKLFNFHRIFKNGWGVQANPSGSAIGFVLSNWPQRTCITNEGSESQNASK